ncbi:Iron-sulfur_cluster biosynthesis protein IscS [Hexamita inflata]|uniref:cysteine desulfurase n=1 Tax=Hexamita inflata TaxID=28002 RepID=A0AA86UN19_9EUKA|nr:Iron-sulfur cluster biosynthesis protein IscS [Hexamita inflata]
MDPRVLEKMIPYMTNAYANCHSQHQAGRTVAQAVEEGRAHVAKVINAQPNEVIFTSGATESNNIAIKGVAKYYGHEKDHVITSKIEHKCVLESVRSLEAEGFNAHYVGVDTDGRLKMDELADILKTHSGKVSLVSVMGANNEVGVVQDLKKIGQLAHDHKALFHTDCAQMVGKKPLDVRADNIDLMSISGHKMYGPKGVGALFINKKNRVRLVPLTVGGGQENNLRSGTVPVFLCVGMGAAAEILETEMPKDIKHYEELTKYALEQLKDVKQMTLNGSTTDRIASNLNVSFIGVEGESLMLAIDDKVAVSTGSACTSQSLEPSHVLHSMGLGPEAAHTAVRIGFGRFTTKEDVKNGMDTIKHEVNRLREISCLWEEK